LSVKLSNSTGLDVSSAGAVVAGLHYFGALCAVAGVAAWTVLEAADDAESR
jgi:hypothetical protein